jgi:hypothetical protein
MKHGITRSPPGRVSESVVRVEQAAKFDNRKDEREEEQRDDRKLGDGRASFVLPVIQGFHVLYSSAPAGSTHM